MVILGHRGYLGAVVARRWAELGASGDYIVNCLFPDDLGLIRRLASQPGLIQPSSDAIREHTDYAATKRVIESIGGVVVIRAGIVDIRKRPARAFTNWYCNPITPLEWADLAWSVRDRPGLHVAGGEIVSRYDVARAVADTFGAPMPRRAEGLIGLDRVQPGDRRRDLVDALAEFREWMGAIGRVVGTNGPTATR